MTNRLRRSNWYRNQAKIPLVSIGNGFNDALMLKESILGISVLGPEGTSFEAMANSDLVTAGINVALDLLLKPERLITTWCK